MDLTLLETLRAKLGLATVGKPVLIGLTAILVMVAVFAGRTIIETATATEMLVEHDSSSGVSSASDSSASQASSGVTEGGKSAESDHDPSDTEEGSLALSSSEEDAETAAKRVVIVYVSGCVKKPGIVELAQGSRVASAIEGAGGFADNAATESINLAREVVDGEQIHVASQEQLQEGATGAYGLVEAPGQISASSTTGTVADTSANGAPINLNTASQSELESLPGIGPATAQKIIADRESFGPFDSVDELTRVSGIGEKKLESLREFVCV